MDLLCSNRPATAFNTIFIIATVAAGLFTDVFLYGFIMPRSPSMLRDRINIPQEKMQSYVFGMLAAYVGASVVFSIPAAWIADRTSARRTPFPVGLAVLLAATVLLAVGRSFAVLFLSGILQKISAAIIWAVGLAMVLDTVGTVIRTVREPSVAKLSPCGISVRFSPS